MARLNAAALPLARRWRRSPRRYAAPYARRCGATSPTLAGQSRRKRSTGSLVAGASLHTKEAIETRRWISQLQRDARELLARLEEQDAGKGATPPCRIPKGPDIDCGTAGLGLDVSQEGPPPSSRPLIQERVPS